MIHVNASEGDIDLQAFVSAVAPAGASGGVSDRKTVVAMPASDIKGPPRRPRRAHPITRAPARADQPGLVVESDRDMGMRQLGHASNQPLRLAVARGRME